MTELTESGAINIDYIENLKANNPGFDTTKLEQALAVDLEQELPIAQEVVS